MGRTTKPAAVLLAICSFAASLCWGCGSAPSPWNRDFGPCVPYPDDRVARAEEVCGVDYCEYDYSVRGYCCGKVKPARADGGVQ